MDDRYLIIAGTDRPGSNTIKLARQYQQLLKEKGIEARLFSLEDYDTTLKGAAREAFQEQWLYAPNKFIFISPEYNGSIPGILKLFIDQAEIKKAWWHKKALLVGLSVGRAGNLRGMDHLMAILHYLKMHVLHNKLPISQVNIYLNNEGFITDDITLQAIDNQLNEFIEF